MTTLIISLMGLSMATASRIPRSPRTYSCAGGQGKSGAVESSFNLNNRELCANKCTETTYCVGFDFTTYYQADACRLFSDTDGARTDVGRDNRKWCISRTPLSPSMYSCVVGQGRSGAAESSFRLNKKDLCANKCTETTDCVGFDYTEINQPDACRLFSETDGARNDGGNDNRKWCTVAGAESESRDRSSQEPTKLAELTVAPTSRTTYSCAGGQGKSGAAESSFNLNNRDDCENKCTETAGCVGFDFTTRSQADACRLFSGTDGARNHGGNDRRKWCTVAESESTAFEIDRDCDRLELHGDCVHTKAYGNNHNCHVTAKRTVQLAWVYFDMEHEPSCQSNYLEFDGRRYCGNPPESVHGLYAPHNAFILREGEQFLWSTDNSVTQHGWEMCAKEPVCTVTLYENDHFEGRKWSYGSGRVPRVDRWSSMEVKGPGCEVTVWENIKFNRFREGWDVTFGQGSYDLTQLRSEGFRNDRMGSIKVERWTKKNGRRRFEAGAAPGRAI